MVQLLAVLVRAIPVHLDVGKQGGVHLLRECEVCFISNRVESQCVPEIVLLFLANDEALLGVELLLAKRVVQSYLKDISSAVVRHLEFSLRQDSLRFLRVNVGEQSLAPVHCWSRYSWRPVIKWFLPSREPFFALLRIVTLVRDMVWVKADFKKGVSLSGPPVNCLASLVKPLVEPLLKVLLSFISFHIAQRGPVLSENLSFLHLLLGLCLHCESPDRVRHE